MSESDRRKFLRVLFEARFEVRAAEWSDKEVTGLDISLNGCRFNCKQSMSDGEKINIVFKPGLELEGSVRWCWPIEWYFQAALQFEDMTQQNQAMLKTYIEEVTGKDYQMQKDEETTQGTSAESVQILEEDLDDIDIDDDLSASIIDVEDQEELPEKSTEEDELEELPPLEEEDLLNLDIEEPIDGVSDDLSETKKDDEFFNVLAKGDINSQSFAGKQVVLYDLEKDQADLLNQYLSERAGMEVEYITKKENLWRLLKIDPMDLVICETGTEGNSDAFELMQQTKDQFPEVHFICISGPVSLERRLQFLNAGALDYFTRPVHLSTIAQSVLVQLSRIAVGDIEEDLTPQGDMMAANEELQEELSLMTEQRDEAIADAKVNEVERNEAVADQEDMMATDKELQEELSLMTEQRDEAIADAKLKATERDEAIAEAEELEQRALHLAEEKELPYLDETFIPDVEPIADSAGKYLDEDLTESASLLDEDLKITEEIDLIEEDY